VYGAPGSLLHRMAEFGVRLDLAAKPGSEETEGAAFRAALTTVFYELTELGAMPSIREVAGAGLSPA